MKGPLLKASYMEVYFRYFPHPGHQKHNDSQENKKYLCTSMQQARAQVKKTCVSSLAPEKEGRAQKVTKAQPLVVTAVNRLSTRRTVVQCMHGGEREQVQWNSSNSQAERNNDCTPNTDTRSGLKAGKIYPAMNLQSRGSLDSACTEEGE